MLKKKKIYFLSGTTFVQKIHFSSADHLYGLKIPKKRSSTAKMFLLASLKSLTNSENSSGNSPKAE
jgi:hypothetical protein